MSDKFNFKTTKGITQDRENPGQLIACEQEIPLLNPDQLLIEVHAAGVNRADLYQAMGKYPPPLGESDILGLEVSGIVVQIGKQVTKFAIGDKVMSLVGSGGYSTYCVASEQTSFFIPSQFSFEQAAAIPEALFTFWLNARMRAQLKAGECFFLHGGASGVGTLSIQLAKQLGAFVITSVRHKEQEEICKELGADIVLNTQNKNWAGLVRQFSPNQKGVDVIMDWVGALYSKEHLELLNKNGRWIILHSEESTLQINLNRLKSYNLSLMGSVLRSRSIEEKKQIAEEMEKNAMIFLRQRKVVPQVGKVFDLKEAEQAHACMRRGGHIGKIVLVCRR